MTQGKYISYTPVKAMKATESITEKLSLQGANYTRHLLKFGRTKNLRETLSLQTGLPLSVVTDLVCQADLMRIRAVGGDASRLLLKAGVTSCRNLHQQDVEALYKRLSALHAKEGMAYHAPTIIQVRSWINEAEFLAETSHEE